MNQNKLQSQRNLITKLHQRPIEECFIENSPCVRNTIKRRIIKDNLITYVCKDCCNTGFHNNKLLSLQLEHKNGISDDNRLENLCFLCPNCHSQIETYAGKKTKTNKKKEYQKKVRERKIKRNEDLYIKNKWKIEKILASSIDFSKWGWVNEVAMLLQMKPQKINKWIKKYMPEFYSQKCHKRKSPDLI